MIIEYDLKNPDRDDKDEFSQILSQVIENYVGIQFNKYIHNDFAEKKGKKICILKIEESTKPVFLKNNGKSEFYIRVGTTTRPLDQKETTEYIADKYTN